TGSRSRRPAPPGARRRTESSGREDQAGADGVGVELAGEVREPRVGRCEPAAAVDDASLGAEPPAADDDRPYEVDLELGGGVGGARGQGGVDRARERRVEQGADDAAMDAADRVVLRLGRLALEDRPA